VCGRFTQMYTWRELVALYRLTDAAPPSNLQPRYNICPTQTIDAVIERDSKHRCPRSQKSANTQLHLALYETR
jgi:putative SOS response-associated peptidase YedK